MSILWHGEEMEGSVKIDEKKSIEEKLDKVLEELNELGNRVLGLERKTPPGREIYPISLIPSVGSVQVVGNRKYKWTKIDEQDQYQAHWRMKILDGEAYLDGDVWIYNDGKRYVKLFKKDVTPRHIPEDAVKFPTDRQMEVLTQLASESAVENSASKFIKDCKL